MWVLEKIFGGLVLDLLEEAASAILVGRRGFGSVADFELELCCAWS